MTYFITLFPRHCFLAIGTLSQTTKIAMAVIYRSGSQPAEGVFLHFTLT